MTAAAIRDAIEKLKATPITTTHWQAIQLEAAWFCMGLLIGWLIGSLR